MKSPYYQQYAPDTTIDDSRVQALSSDEPEAVRNAMNALIHESSGNEKIVQELNTQLLGWEYDDTMAPFWAAVALGEMRARAALPFLLTTLDTNPDADLFNEAVGDAIAKIAERHPDEAVPMLDVYVQHQMSIQNPYAASAAIEALIAPARAGDKQARTTAIEAFAQSKMSEIIYFAHLPNDLGDPALLPLLHRALLVARVYEDDAAENELRWEYAHLAGIVESVPDKGTPLWEKPWEERWQHMLEDLGKKEEEIAAKEEARLDEIEQEFEYSDSSTKYDEQAKTVKEMALPPFSLADYLAVRPRTSREWQFDSVLRLLGFDAYWNVEQAQELLSTAKNIENAARQLSEGWSDPFPTDRAYEEFLQQAAILWNATPREEIDYLTPEEMMYAESAREENAKIRENIEQMKKRLQRNKDGANKKPQRNDPCPCGSGKKYKKCCGTS